MKKIFIVLIILGIIVLCVSINTCTSTYVMQKGNSRIVLWGNIHAGTPMYWGILQKNIDMFDCVIYEDIRKKSECKIWPVVEPFYNFAKSMNLEYMGDYIQYPDRYLADVDMDYIYTFYSEEDIQELQETMSIFNELSQPIGWLLFGIGSFIESFNDDLLVTMRNDKPIQSALQLSEQYNNILIIYGQQHIRYMKKMLKGEGYKETDFVLFNPWK